ncbi:MAG: choice-of-anchor D domain-containing protein, partial [Cyanobacteria bacterium J06627_8]
MVQTLPRTSMQSTETPNLLTLARSGNADAIAQLIGRALADHGVFVSGTVTENQLDLKLTGHPLPEQQQVIPLIKTGLMRLGFQSIRSVVLQAMSPEPSNPSNSGWTYRFQLSDALNTPLAPRPDTESLVKVHGGTATVSNSLQIGHHRVHHSTHGHVVCRHAESPPPLRRRSPPTAAQSCDPVPSMLDRQPETQDALSGLLTDQPVEFYGEHGLGKSVMLHNLTHSPNVRRQFTDGVSYRRVASRPLDDVLREVFTAFYEWETQHAVQPTPSELYVALRSLNALIVLDDLPSGSAPLISEMGTTMLLASDIHQLTDVGQAIPMRGLPIPEAMTLVEQRLGRSLSDASERQAAEAICRQLKGHPLRIIQTTSFLRTFQRSATTPELPSTLPQLLEQLRAGLSPEALIIRAATTLPELERRVLAVLAVFEHVSIAPEHLSVLTGSSNLDLTFQILRERGLIGGDRNGYRLASNLLPYFRKIWDLTPWIERSITYFTTWVQQQDLSGSSTDIYSTLWWTTQLAAQQQQWDAVLTLCRLLDGPFMLSKQWGRWKQIWELGLAAARSIGDGAAEAHAFHQLGSRALCMGDLFTAHTYLTEAIQRRVALRDEIGAAISQHNISLLFLASDDSLSDSHVASVSVPSDVNNAAAVSNTDTPGSPASPFTRIQQPTIVSVPHPPPVARGRIDVAKIEALTRQIGSGEPVNPASDTSTGNLKGPSSPSPSRPLPPQSRQSVSGTSSPQQARQSNSTNAGGNGSGAIAPVTSGAGTNGSQTNGSQTNGAARPSNGAIAHPSSTATTQLVGPTATASPDAQSTGSASTSSRKITPTPRPSVTRPDSPPKVYGAATEARSFPIGWIVVGLIAAVFGGLGAFLALNWNRTPFAINPRSVTFTPQLLNVESSRRGITIKNTSRETIELSSVAFSKGDRFDFSIVDQTCTDRPLRPNANCTIGLTFSPQEDNARSAVLRLADQTGEYVRSIQVRGIGESAQVSFEPEGLSFPTTLTGGGEQSTRTITVTNESAIPFSMGEAFISGERRDAFSIGQDNCNGQRLAPNESCSVEVVFTPTDTGELEANFGISVASEDQPRLEPLIGIGELVAPTLSASTLSFGDEVVGRLSTRTVSVTNNGGSPLTIDRATISGNSSNFRIQGNSCSQATLQPGEGCQVTVGFSPQSERQYSGTLSIQDNAANSPRSVSLTGRGSRVASPELSPSPLGFGEQEVGTTREEVVTLTNRGDRSIQVQSASLSNDNEFSISSDACSGNSLAAGSSCTITVQFTPQDMGDRSTTLTISDTATGSPRSLSITGTGAMVPRPQILSMEARPATIRSGERT